MCIQSHLHDLINLAMNHYQKFTLVSALLAVSLSFLGCNTTSTEPTSYDVLESTPNKLVYDSPKAEIIINGENPIDQYVKSLSVDLSSISKPLIGSDNTPFTFEQSVTNQKGNPSFNGSEVYPPDNTTANLLFYKKVGLPLLKIEQLDSDFIRIWLRVRNLQEGDIFVSVKCEGSDDYGRIDEQYRYDEVIFQEDVFRDFTFVLRGDISKKFSIIVTDSSKNY